MAPADKIPETWIQVFKQIINWNYSRAKIILN